MVSIPSDQEKNKIDVKNFMPVDDLQAAVADCESDEESKTPPGPLVSY